MHTALCDSFISRWYYKHKVWQNVYYVCTNTESGIECASSHWVSHTIKQWHRHKKILHTIHIHMYLFCTHTRQRAQGYNGTLRLCGLVVTHPAPAALSTSHAALKYHPLYAY